MSLSPKSPLLRKRAMDALLETMDGANYDSLGGYSRGQVGMLPEQKGTEPDSTHQAPVVIPADDLAEAPDPATAEFYKESDPKTGAVIHRPGRGYRLPTKSVEETLGEVDKEARKVVPVEDDVAGHEFFKEAPKTGATKRLSPTQLAILRGAEDGKPLFRVPGGFWTWRQPDSFDNLGLPKWEGEGDSRPWADIRTIRSLEKLGLLRRTGRWPQEWRDERVITDAGKAAIETGRTEMPKTTPKQEVVEKMQQGWTLGILYLKRGRGYLEKGAESIDVPTSLIREMWKKGIIESLDDTQPGGITFRLAEKGKTSAVKVAGHRVEDTGEYDEEKESRIRRIARDTAQYAESGPMFDPSGEYLCKGCRYMLGNTKCAFVEGDDISKEHGTCRYWKAADGKAPVELERKYSKKEAGYAERKDQPFGCKRCEYGSGARKPDSEGRESWCQFFGMHILPDACCAENSLHGDVSFNDDNTVSKRGGFVPLEALSGKAAAEKLQVGGRGRDHRGEYEVLSISGDEIVYQYPGAEPQKGSLEIKQRIHNNISAEEKAKEQPAKAPAMLSEAEITWTPELAHFLGYLAGPGDVSFYLDVPPKYEDAVVNKYHELTGEVIEPRKGVFNIADSPGRWYGRAFIRFKPTGEVPDLGRNVLGGTIAEYKPGLIHSYGLFWSMVRMGFRLGAEQSPSAIRDRVPGDMRDYFDLGVGREQVPVSKEADSPTKSYGMGTPIGGTANPAGGASDEEEMEDEELAQQNAMNVSVASGDDDWEYDPYDYDAEDARLAAAMDEEDDACESAARLWASVVDGEDMPSALEKIAGTGESGWFAKSARPSEQKVELVSKQFKLTPEQMEEVIRTDPSPNQSDFVGWIAKWLSQGALRLPEDSEKVRGQLEKFQKLKKSPAFTFNKDIQRYDPATLFDTLEQAAAAGMGSKKEQRRETVRKGADVVVKEGDVTIYKVTEPAAAKELGGGTNWCTAAPDSDFAADYLSQGPLYIFFDAGSAVAQLHPESGQFMNRQDVCMLEPVRGESGRYGRYDQRTEKFLADPSLSHALGLLAEKEPSVKKWVEKNVTSPEKVLEILGEESKEEAEYNAKYDAALAQYEKDLAEYEAKAKEFQPVWDRYQKMEQRWQKRYDEWREKRDRGEEAGKPPEAPERPHGPQEPRHPGQPYNYAYGYTDRASTKRFTYQVRNALATRTPLPPEIEQQLAGSDVSTDLLLKYGSLFHPGQPWEPLAQALLAKAKKTGEVGKEAVDYAAKFIKGAWPEIEPLLLSKVFLQTRNLEKMRTALDYAIRARKTRWPEFEDKIHKAKPGAAAGYGSAEYAIRVLKQPWSALPGIKRKKNGRLNEEEVMIAGAPGEARKYAEAFFQGNRWPEFENAALEAGNLAALINYAADTLHARMPELEEKILSGQRDAQEQKGRRRWRSFTDLPLAYAEKVIKGRWPEYEEKLLAETASKDATLRGDSKFVPTSQRPHYYGYGRDHGDLGEDVAGYVSKVVGGRWPELEAAMLARYQSHPGQWPGNQRIVDSYLVTLNAACQERLKDSSPAEEEEEDTRPTMEQINNPRPRRDERVLPKYTKFTQDARCYWPEGEERLVTRDPGYEEALLAELRGRANPQGEQEQRNWGKENKYVSPEDLARMERPPEGASVSYEEREKKPSYTIWNGLWIGWYGMDALENYVDYFLANGVDWKEGVDILEIAEDLEDVRGRYSYQTRPQRRQRGLQFASSLLRKRGLVEMHESPDVLPPRDDIKEHLDQQLHDQLTKEVMQGVREPLNPKRKRRLPQIDPRVNPDGVVAAIEDDEDACSNCGTDMEGTKTCPSCGQGAPRKGKAYDDRVEREFQTASALKRADHTQEDRERGEAQAFLDRAEDAEDEAKRHFMQEGYLKQIAQDEGVPMERLWEEVGGDYAAEFYGWPQERVPDFTDGTVRTGDPRVASAASRVYVRFLDKELGFDSASEALEFAKGVSAAHPGEPAVLVIDEEGVVTEDTFADGRRVGETVEKFGFRGTR